MGARWSFSRKSLAEIGRCPGGVTVQSWGGMLIRLALGPVLLLAALPAHATDTWTTPFVGVEVLHRKTASPHRNIWAVRVNLDASGVMLAATAYPGPTRRTPREWAQLVGAQIAINGDFFDSSNGATWGMAAGFGALWPLSPSNTDGSTRGVLLFNDKSQVEMRPTEEVTTFPSWARHAVSFSPDVLRNGVPTTAASEGAAWNVASTCANTERAPRSAVGLSQNERTLILLTADGYDVLNTGNPYVGLNCTEIGEILLELGAYHGGRLDGGNSTAMYIQGYPSGVPSLPSNANIVNIPANLGPSGHVVTVANHIGVFATPSGSPVTVNLTANPTSVVVWADHYPHVDHLRSFLLHGERGLEGAPAYQRE
jgi:exopolysaccharide biosynthesis protein